MNRAAQDLAAEALFVSDIQPSERPTRYAIAQTITATLLCYGNAGCAAEFAAQFGDHPDTAARRMSWARGELEPGGPESANPFGGLSARQCSGARRPPSNAR